MYQINRHDFLQREPRGALNRLNFSSTNCRNWQSLPHTQTANNNKKITNIFQVFEDEASEYPKQPPEVFYKTAVL